MTIPMHKIKKFLNENKKINLKIKKNLKLNELKNVPVGSFKDGTRVNYEYLGPCVVIRHEDGKVVLRCEKDNKLYRVASTTLVSTIQDAVASSEKNQKTDLVFRPSAMVNKQVAQKENTPPDLSKYTIPQLRNAIVGLKKRKEEELIAKDYKKLDKTNQLINYIDEYLKNHQFDYKQYSVSENLDDITEMLVAEWTKENTMEENNITYAYSVMCDIAVKLQETVDDIGEDVDLTKMTTGALQKHFIANQEKAKTSQVYANQLTKIKRELANRRFAVKEEKTKKKPPTQKQVQAAKDRYEAMGLRIERAKAKAGYAKGGSSTSELQSKKGDLYKIYMDLKREYEQSLSEVTENKLTLDELRTKQKQLQQLQLRTDLNQEQKFRLKRAKASLYSQAMACGLGDYIAEEMSIDDYKQRRKVLQQLQMDPDTSRDPLLKKAVMSRLASLNSQAKSSGLQIMEDELTAFEIGDAVVVIGHNQFNNCNGVVNQLGTNGEYIVVDLENKGKHCFNKKELALCSQDSSLDEDFDDFMTGLKRKWSGKPSAEDLKLRHFERGDLARKQGDRKTATKEFNRYLKIAKLTNDTEMV